MKKIITLILGLALSAPTAQARIAFATFATDHHYNLQILIDGLVINKKPKPVVKIKGKVGVHQITIKAFDDSGCLMDTYNNHFTVRSGLASDYKIFSDANGFLQMKLTGYKMIYHERLRRPDWFYNNRLVADSYDALSICCDSKT